MIGSKLLFFKWTESLILKSSTRPQATICSWLLMTYNFTEVSERWEIQTFTTSTIWFVLPIASRVFYDLLVIRVQYYPKLVQFVKLKRNAWNAAGVWYLKLTFSLNLLSTGHALGIWICVCSLFYKRELWTSKSAGANSAKSLKICRCKRWCPKGLRAPAAPVLTHSLFYQM